MTDLPKTDAADASTIPSPAETAHSDTEAVHIENATLESRPVTSLETQGGTIPGDLYVNGSVVINGEFPRAPLYAVKGESRQIRDDDEEPQSAIACDAIIGVDSFDSYICAINGVAMKNNDNTAQVVEGLNLMVGGENQGFKRGMRTVVSGPGRTKGADFLAITTAGTNTDDAVGVHVTASNAGPATTHGLVLDVAGSGAGSKTGISCNSTGERGAKQAGYFNAKTTASNATERTDGVFVSASSVGSGPVSALTIGAGSTSTTTAAQTHGIYLSAIGNGPGQTFGIRSIASGSGTGTKYALHCSTNGGGTKYAGYFAGNVHVQGTLTKTSGAFLIDHPDDPYNRKLRHSFVESSEDMCVYRGKVAIDKDGKGIVQMPSYFASLTKEEEATVSLTPIGSEPFLASYEWNRKCTAFTVHGKPNSQVSYIVMANRDDPAIHVLREPVDQEKTADERGKLLFPEAYAGTSAPAKKHADTHTPIAPDACTEEIRLIETLGAQLESSHKMQSARPESHRSGAGAGARSMSEETKTSEWQHHS
jgi:hypothetical protein